MKKSLNNSHLRKIFCKDFKIINFKNSLCLTVLMILLSFLEGNAQNTNLALNWNISVGCQTYSQTDDPRKDIIFLEDIADDVCIKVCAGTVVTYTITGDLAGTPITTWSVTGGTILSSSATNLIVRWGGAGDGSVSFVITTATGTISKTLCIKKVNVPKANFNIFQKDPELFSYTVCQGVPISFNNLSLTNNGTSIVASYWDFENGIISQESNPTIIFDTAGEYKVSLIVTNECNCKSEVTKIIKVVKSDKIEITCPSVVCEGQKETYYLSQQVGENCFNESTWQVQGGQIVSNSTNGAVSVIWNNVDDEGFGYLTFNPSNCDLQCLVPTTVKIPVIDTNGAIKGNSITCLGSQERYTLPQWPSTIFNWEIVGNDNNNLAIVIPTDQRNEVIIQANQSGVLTLVCNYYNTLLKCGGKASFQITVNLPEPITGNTSLCVTNTGSFQTISGNPVNWILRNANGTVVGSPLLNSNTYTHTFNTAGTFTLEVSGSGICQGQITTISVLTVPPAISASSINGQTNDICPSYPYTYTIINPNPLAIYYWEIVGGTIEGAIAGTPTTGITINAKFNAGGNTELMVYQKLNTASACRSLGTTIPINLLQINATISDKANYSLVNNMSVCANNTKVYRAVKSTGPLGLYDTGDNYVWSITPSNLGSIILGQGTKQVTVLWNNVLDASGVANATLSLQIKKCTVTTTFSKNVAIIKTPTLTLTSDAPTCSGNAVNFMLTSNVFLNANTPIVWDYGVGSPATIAGSGQVITNSHTYNNASGNNNTYVVTATIASPNGCSGNISASTTVIIAPGSNAGISLLSGANLFCEANQINTVISASITAGATYQWFKVPFNNPIQNGGNLNVATIANGGFGLYYFVTNNNGCTTTSPFMAVSQDNCSGSDGNCTIAPPPNIQIVQNANVAGNCSSLSFTGSYVGTALSNDWTILGPDTNISNVVGNNGGNNQYLLPVTQAGIYNIFYTASFNSTENQPCTAQANLNVTVPYVPRFKTGVECLGNGVFNVNLTDDSSFMNNITNKNFIYSKSNSANGPFVALNTTSSQNFVVNNLTAGTYYFKLSIYGNNANGQQPTCEVVLPLTIAPDPVQSISFQTPISCFDKAIEFNISGFLQSDTYLWTFENQNTQNTQAAPSRVFDPTPNGAAQTVNINVVVTNKYGCQKTLTAAVNIPARCYFGDIGTIGGNTACVGSPVTLKYTASTSDNCTTVSQYQWMNGNNPVPIATTTTNAFNVYTSGLYWLRLINNNGCVYNCPSTITPTFVPKPTAKMGLPSIICFGSNAYANAITNALDYNWILDGENQDAYNGISNLPLNNLAIGDHTVTLTAYANGCSDTVSQIVSVVDYPGLPTLTYTVLDCTSYKTLITATAPGDGMLTWSNGANGDNIIVYAGGPYSVSYNNGSGCITTAQIDVPYSLDKYLWIFPKGCYYLCEETQPSLIGPNLPVDYWNWMLNSSPIANGIGFVSPLTLTQGGTYSLSLTAACEQVSETMDLKINECADCKFEKVEVLRLTPNFRNGFCSYDLNLLIVNGGNVLNTVLSSLSPDLLVVTPAFNCLSGINDYYFNIVPLNGFNGGNVYFQLNGTDIYGEKCIYTIRIEFPACGESGRTIERTIEGTISDDNTKNSQFNLYPNPTNGQVNVSFNVKYNPTIELYDLMGRLINQYQATELKGTWVLDLEQINAGVYIVLIKENGTITQQQKLIVK